MNIHDVGCGGYDERRNSSSYCISVSDVKVGNVLFTSLKPEIDRFVKSIYWSRKYKYLHGDFVVGDGGMQLNLAFYSILAICLV